MCKIESKELNVKIRRERNKRLKNIINDKRENKSLEKPVRNKETRRGNERLHTHTPTKLFSKNFVSLT